MLFTNEILLNHLNVELRPLDRGDLSKLTQLAADSRIWQGRAAMQVEMKGLSLAVKLRIIIYNLESS